MPQKRYKEIAYEQLFTLSTHYSNLIFKARLMIITVVLVLWGLTLGFYKFGTSNTDPQLEPILPYLGALAVSFFPLLEALYIKLYWSTFEAGKSLESGQDIYFSRRKAPVVLPFMSFYALNCLAFIALYVIKLPGGTKAYGFLGMIPFAFLGAAIYYMAKGRIDRK